MNKIKFTDLNMTAAIHILMKLIIKKENIQNIEKENKFLIIGLLASNSNFYDYVVENYIRKFVNYIDEKELYKETDILSKENYLKKNKDFLIRKLKEISDDR